MSAAIIVLLVILVLMTTSVHMKVAILETQIKNLQRRNDGV